MFVAVLLTLQSPSCNLIKYCRYKLKVSVFNSSLSILNLNVSYYFGLWDRWVPASCCRRSSCSDRLNKLFCLSAPVGLSILTPAIVASCVTAWLFQSTKSEDNLECQRRCRIKGEQEARTLSDQLCWSLSQLKPRSSIRLQLKLLLFKPLIAKNGQKLWKIELESGFDWSQSWIISWRQLSEKEAGQKRKSVSECWDLFQLTL